MNEEQADVVSLGDPDFRLICDNFAEDTAYMRSQTRGTMRSFWIKTVFLNLALMCVFQAIGCLMWGSAGVPESVSRAAIPSEVLHTDLPWYSADGGSLTGFMSDQTFLRCVTFLLWTITVVTGLGMEAVLGEPLVARMGEAMAMQAWKCAQLVFALSVMVSILSASAFGVMFAVLGFWKLGFPETLGCFRRAFRIPGFNLGSIGAYINGIGTVLHHSAGAWLVCGAATRLAFMDRRILSLALPLVCQHVFVLCKYWNGVLYILMELGIEVYWQREVICSLAHLGPGDGYDISVRGVVLQMLFAHWCYWVSGIMGAVHVFVRRRKRIRPGAREDAVEEIQRQADADTLDYGEFWIIIQKNKLRISPSKASRLFSIADVDGNGLVSAGEVGRLIDQLHALASGSESETEEVFEMASGYFDDPLPARNPQAKKKRSFASSSRKSFSSGSPSLPCTIPSSPLH